MSDNLPADIPPAPDGQVGMQGETGQGDLALEDY